MSEILVIQRIFAKYRKDVFDELNNHIGFKLIHSKNKSGIKQVSATYSTKIGSIHNSNNPTNVFLNVFPYILKNRPRIIIHEFSIGIASLIPTYLLTRLLGIKFILWGHGYDRTKGFYPTRSMKDKLRIWCMKKSDAVILYGKEAKTKLMEYVPSEKLFIAFNCLNTRILTSLRDKLEMEGRENVKKRIGFTHQYNLIFIGRILEAKKPQLIIEVYELLIKMHNRSVGIHFVGDGEYLNTLKQFVKNRGMENNIKFYGAIHDNATNGEMLYCSDLMVMPGYIGLSLNHAFNFDCPVVTFQQKEMGPYHSPEIEYLINDKTGFIVDNHTVEEMSIIISTYLNREELQDRIKMNIRYMIENICSIDNFIKGFKDAIEYVIHKK